MNAEVLLDTIFLKCLVGSTAHGTGHPDEEDRDEMAIAYEPPSCIYGLNKVETLTHRPGRKPHEPSKPGDLDLVVHPLKKFCSLALKANPSILMMFWAPTLQSNEWGWYLRANTDKFVSQRIFDTHLGYAYSQMKRLRNGKAYESRKANVEKYGYDTKYAMHALRLLMQGIEISNTGKLQLPIPDPDAAILKDLRFGKFSFKEFEELFNNYDRLLKLEKDKNNLPPDPDSGWVDIFLQEFYLTHFNKKALENGII